jgi:hypothetical protein
VFCTSGTWALKLTFRGNRQFQLLVYACRGRCEVRYHIADYAEFFQHNQQCDTLLPIIPCRHKLKAGITYWKVPVTEVDIANVPEKISNDFLNGRN